MNNVKDQLLAIHHLMDAERTSKIGDNDRELILVGCRGSFDNLVQTAQCLGITIAGILDKYYPVGHTVNNIPVIGSEDILLEDTLEAEEFRNKYNFFPGMFWAGDQNLQNKGLDNGQVRLDRLNLLDKSGVRVINLISPLIMYFPSHPQYDSTRLKIGRGVFIGEYTGMTHDVEIGDYCYIDDLSCLHSHVTLGRNVSIGARSTLAHTVIEDNCRVGLNCTIAGGHRDYITVGTGSTVWSGSNVIKDVPEDSMYVPPPGRILKKTKTINDE